VYYHLQPLLRLQKNQVLCNQANPASFAKTPGVGVGATNLSTSDSTFQLLCSLSHPSNPVISCIYGLFCATGAPTTLLISVDCALFLSRWGLVPPSPRHRHRASAAPKFRLHHRLFDRGSQKPMRRRSHTAPANRGRRAIRVPSADIRARSTTYDVDAAQFGGVSSAAPRLHPTWLLPFTQHPRGASAPAARMSYTIFLSGRPCRHDRKAN